MIKSTCNFNGSFVQRSNLGFCGSLCIPLYRPRFNSQQILAQTYILSCAPTDTVTQFAPKYECPFSVIITFSRKGLASNGKHWPIPLSLYHQNFQNCGNRYLYCHLSNSLSQEVRNRTQCIRRFQRYSQRAVVSFPSPCNRDSSNMD